MGPKETAFDRWLSRALHTEHDGVMAEPMPDELLRLVLECRGTEHPLAPDHAVPAKGRYPRCS
jgi:hypothetical protein